MKLNSIFTWNQLEFSLIQLQNIVDSDLIYNNIHISKRRGSNTLATIYIKKKKRISRNNYFKGYFISKNNCQQLQVIKSNDLR